MVFVHVSFAFRLTTFFMRSCCTAAGAVAAVAASGKLTNGCCPLLVVMVFGTLGGMAVTYLNNGKLFVGPHLLVGLAMTGMIAVAASLSPLMQRGNVIARKAHVGLNMGTLTLFLWQAVSGMEIVNKIWENRPS